MIVPEDILEEYSRPDALLAGFELQYRETFHPWGFPFELETNSKDVIASAMEGWSAFCPCFNEAPVRLCLVVTEDDSPLLTPNSTIASREHLMSVFGDASNFMLLDFRHGFGFGCVTSATATDHPLLHYRFLMTALMLVEQRSLAPLHGALVVKNGQGVMLAGDSLAGKSTLAYAASRAGWSYVTDDGVSLVRARSDRFAVGDYTSLRLREDARRFFPELDQHRAVVRPNGKVAIELRTRALPIRTLPGHSVDHVVFLARQDSGPASIRAFPPEQALAEWEQFRSFGSSETRGAQEECHRNLLKTGIWEMRYSRLQDAVACLELLAAGREAA
jgi:hypothetical protein